WPPPAQTSLCEIASTASNPAEKIFGLWTSRHVLPFQCSISGDSRSVDPTAQTSSVASAETLLRSPAPGVGTTVHRAPSQCSASSGPSGGVADGDTRMPTARHRLVHAP